MLAKFQSGPITEQKFDPCRYNPTRYSSTPENSMPAIPRDLGTPAYSSSLVAAGGPVHEGQAQGDTHIASQEVGWANTLGGLCTLSPGPSRSWHKCHLELLAGYHTHEVTAKPDHPPEVTRPQAVHPHNHPQVPATSL
jgi:hypothetical protein